MPLITLSLHRETLETPDKGIVCLDWFDNDDSTVYKNADTRPTVLILPGLTGKYVTACTTASCNIHNNLNS